MLKPNYLKIGKTVRYSKESLDEFLKECEVNLSSEIKRLPPIKPKRKTKPLGTAIN
jgi:hypothetical protein